MRCGCILCYVTPRKLEPVQGWLFRLFDAFAHEFASALCACSWIRRVGDRGFGAKRLTGCVWQLDCAMGDGTIETAEYLRLVHKLSRQQFLEKELALKILAKRRSLGVC